MSIDQRIDYSTQLKKQPHIFDVTYYGAVGDGATDCTAAINAAITAMGSSPGILYFPFGKFNTTGPHTISHGTQSIVGMGKGTYINKTSATGNLFNITASSGNIFFNEIRNLLLVAGVTQTAGDFIYIDPTALIGELHSIFIQGAYNAFNMQGGSTWHGSNLSTLDAVNVGFTLRSGLYTNLKSTTNSVGSKGVLLSGPVSTGYVVDGIQINGLFIEGPVDYGIYAIPDLSLGGSVYDVSISNFIIDLFKINAIRLTGTGPNGFINFTNIHVGNQTSNAANDHALRFDGKVGSMVINGGRIFNNRKRGISFEGASANTDNVIKGVVIQNNSLASVGTHSAIFADSINGLVINGCHTGATKITSGGATHKYGLELANVCNRVNAVGNSFYDFVTAATSGTGSATNSNFADNLSV